MLMRKSIAAAHVYPTLEALLAAVRDCRACEAHLLLGPRPLLRAGATARILVVGQAPGVHVHTTSIPWDDPSGERLRTWMGVDKDVLYDESRIAIIPVGYCYPGRGKGGDMPPRRECATLSVSIRSATFWAVAASRHWPKRSMPGGSRPRNTSRCPTPRRAISRGSRTIPGLSGSSYRCCARESTRCVRAEPNVAGREAFY
jgi:hypothetical protein